MTTAQDQQSRAEFEAFWRKEMNVEAMDLARTNYPMTPPEKQQYLCHETNRAWITWQAARALPAGMEPVAVASMPFCRLEWLIGETVSAAEVAEISRQGARLHTAAQVLAMGRVPPGWQAVPVKCPTAICCAIEREIDSQLAASGITDLMHRQDGTQVWDEALAAAPQPPAAQEGA